MFDVVSKIKKKKKEKPKNKFTENLKKKKKTICQIKSISIKKCKVVISLFQFAYVNSKIESISR